MSLKSFKREFFGSVKRAARSDLAAAEHALKKYTGALPENLEKHGGMKTGDLASLSFADDVFWFDADECALCHRHNDH